MKSRVEAEQIIAEMERITAEARENAVKFGAQVAAAHVLLDLLDIGTRLARKAFDEKAF
jgi:hypothetical protein